MMSEAVLILSVIGLFFVFSAALGTLRFPDPLSRMHAITKAGTLGVGLFMAAAAVHFGSDISLVTRAVAVTAFTLITAPASAQMIGRAAYLCGAAPVDPSRDQLRARYPDPATLFASRPAVEDAVHAAPEEH
ncbi:MAG: monovalent cation/H(+) antiporter subunit G [Myxococcota bacterium]